MEVRQLCRVIMSNCQEQQHVLHLRELLSYHHNLQYLRGLNSISDLHKYLELWYRMYDHLLHQLFLQQEDVVDLDEDRLHQILSLTDDIVIMDHPDDTE
jgi:hypothetical protein